LLSLIPRELVVGELLVFLVLFKEFDLFFFLGVERELVFVVRPEEPPPLTRLPPGGRRSPGRTARSAAASLPPTTRYVKRQELADDPEPPEPAKAMR
jgi:hypothetical protein